VPILYIDNTLILGDIVSALRKTTITRHHLRLFGMPNPARTVCILSDPAIDASVSVDAIWDRLAANSLRFNVAYCTLTQQLPAPYESEISRRHPHTSMKCPHCAHPKCDSMHLIALCPARSRMWVIAKTYLLAWSGQQDWSPDIERSSSFNLLLSYWLTPHLPPNGSEPDKRYPSHALGYTTATRYRMYCIGAIPSTLQTALAVCGFPKPYSRIVAEQIIDTVHDTIFHIWCECFKNGKSVAFLSEF
jgi:hypothetical protein